MKSAGVLLLFFVGTALSIDLPPELQQILKARQDECLASNPVDKNILKEARNGNFADDPQLRNYIFCNLHKGAFLTEDGVLRNQIAQIKLSLAFGKEKAFELVDKCKEDSNKDKFIFGQKLIECIYNDTKVSII